jgi:hypothetical protein
MSDANPAVPGGSTDTPPGQAVLTVINGSDIDAQ